MSKINEQRGGGSFCCNVFTTQEEAGESKCLYSQIRTIPPNHPEERLTSPEMIFVTKLYSFILYHDVI